MKDTTTVDGHTWERQEPGWWTCSCNTGSYGVCQERDGWYLYGPGPDDGYGPYFTMGLAMEQMSVAVGEEK